MATKDPFPPNRTDFSKDRLVDGEWHVESQKNFEKKYAVNRDDLYWKLLGFNSRVKR